MLSVILCVASLSPGQPAAWPMDELTLTNGAKYRGCIVEETKLGIRFRGIRQPPGRPTVTLTSVFPTGDVQSVKRLNDQDRKILLAKLAELDETTTGERKRADELTLTPLRHFDRAILRYEGEDFTLNSLADEETTRRTAIRLEQIFTAYQRYFPPRKSATRPLAIYLTADPADYDHIAQRTLKITALTPIVPSTAFFDPASNKVVCGTDLRQLGRKMASIRKEHQEELAKVVLYEQQIQDLYKAAPKAERDRHLDTAAKARARILAADRSNDARFDEATAKLFRRLYHEAFHAYNHNFVYPERTTDAKQSGPGALPRWLNEGLAQIFETAILDGFELRVGHADAERLEKLQAGLQKKKGGLKLLALSELLRSGESNFTLDKSAATVELRYMTAWAVAYHLLFEKRVIGTKAFDEYLAKLNSGGSVIPAFEKLVGQDATSYEQELHRYLLKLKPDGSLRK